MDENAEKKYLASLDFKTKDAEAALDIITDKLNKLAETSDKDLNNISNKLKTTFNVTNVKFDWSKMMNSQEASKLIADYAKKHNLTVSQTKKLYIDFYEEILKQQSQTTKSMIANNEREYQSNLKILESEQIEANKTAENKKRNEDNVATYKEQLRAREESRERQHQQNLTNETKKGVTDRIAEYAKTYLIYQGFNQLKQAAAETVQEMVNVESQMVAIERVMEEGSIVVDEYRDKLIQLAYDYGNSFDNVADITLRLAQAGFDAEESLALTEKTLLALNTADLDATEATSDMVAIMAQWGKMTGNATEEAEEYASIIDKINKVADNFPTTSSDILDALKKTSSAFNIAGASIDETIATIVAAEKASQRGGKAIGTALSNITQQLKETKKEAIAEGLGITFYTDETKTQYKDLMEILGELSAKMQQLKADGKESSVEMQELLSVFTVFRRNIGASLLGEMAGEMSTYQQVIETINSSVGYSISENEKYMRTAEAAQQQFNATLLELKTSVWDNGLRDVFTSMLLMGGDLAKAFKFLTDTFGTLPTVIGVCVLALSTFDKRMKLVEVDTKNLKLQFGGFIKQIQTTRTVVDAYNKGLISSNEANTMLANVGIKSANIALISQQGSLVAATLKTVGLKVATIALQATLSLGLSLAITAVVSLLNDLIHAEERAAEKVEEVNNYWKEATATAKETSDEYNNQAKSLEELIKQYDKIGQKNVISGEDLTTVLDIQTKIKSIAGDTANTIDLQNGKYEEQIKLLNQINTKQLAKSIEEQKEYISELRKEVNNFVIDTSNGNVLKGLFKYNEDFFKYSENLFDDFGKSFHNIVDEVFNNIEDTTIEDRIKKFEELKSKMELDGKTNTEAYDWVKDSLKELRSEQEKLTEATDEYYNNLAKLKVQEWFLDDNKIKSVEDFRQALELIEQAPLENIEGFEERVISILTNAFPQFNTDLQVINGNVEALDTSLSNHLTTLQNYETQYAQLTAAQEEYNKTGQLTLGTLKDLIDNDLLQYLEFQDGQLRINTQSLLDMAEAEKIATINMLQEAATADINKAALGDLEGMSVIAKNAIAQFGNNAQTTGNQAETATGKILSMAAALAQAKDAAEGKLGDGVDLNTFRRNVSAITNAYMSAATTISNISVTGGSYTPSSYSRSSRGSGGSSSSGSSTAAANAAQRAAEQAAKDAEAARKAVVKAFEDEITERERLEQRFVKNKKALGLLSNEDEKYILQESIKRYKKYAEEVNQLTMATEEEKLELRKKYLEKAEDLEVDYIELLNDLLDDQLDAIENKYKDDVDAYKDATSEKIDAIKAQAQAEIDALKAVEDENDRIRKKEEYEEKRKELVSGYQGVEYWKARTGREAQLALAEAEKKLAELDQDWEDTLAEWAVDDQILLIEQRRDADIAATEAERDAYLKALEETKNAEIEAMKDKYQYEIDYFNQTGQIITDNAIIQSEELFKIYKENFVDPIGSELTNALSSQVQTSTTTSAAPAVSTPSTIDYTIQWGDTLTAIARRYNTTIEKILQANPYITDRNLIYAGRNLKIPTSHTGSKIIKDGLVELQAGETVLNMEWAKGLDKMLGEFNKQNITNNTIEKGNTINVNGSLIDFDAKIDDNVDVSYLTKKLTRELSQKFNIK